MRTFSLDDKSAVFAFRGIIFLAMVLLLVHSRRLEESFELVPFVLAGFYLACGEDWRRWLAAALGFGFARVVIARIIRADIKAPQPAAESHHAS